tara:strand:- start:3474 stop:5369 length:1896 start_codon:yes stop_codon:yes gene_type:complete
MPLFKLQFKPGINKEVTSYSNEGGWRDSDKIRFRFGVPEKIGGWIKDTLNTFLGTSRALKTWVTLSGLKLLGVGTNLKYYINRGGEYKDITPLRATINVSNNGVTTGSAGSGIVTIQTASAHGAVQNDFVTLASLTTTDGITAAQLNKEHQIIDLTNTSGTISTTHFKIDTGGSATSGSTAGGGSSGTAAFQINTGLDSTVFGTGWGTGTWGRGTWDSDGTPTQSAILRIWSHDNFGEDLIINIRNGSIYYWDTSADTLGSSRATELKSVSGADSTTPTIATQIMVDPNVHVIAFGCDAETAIGTQDPLLIRFSDQGTATTWQSLATNSAGDLRVTSGSEIVQAIKTRQQILVFTDVSVHTLQFLGPPFTFGLNLVSENITIMGPNAAKAVDDFVFWMGAEDFYAYDGRVQKLPCSVKAFIFNDFNLGQKEKVFAALNSTFNEVWWFYPTSSSEEIDRYVIYNYVEKSWAVGTLTRTSWIDRGIFDFPLATDSSGILYTHENGLNDGSTTTPSAISAHIESSQIDIEDGDNFLFLDRLIPDITFTGSEDPSPKATFTLKTRNFPGGNYLQSNDSDITQSVAETSTIVEQFTEQAFVRLRGRSFALKVASSQTGVQWRLGSSRVQIRPDGRR